MWALFLFMESYLVFLGKWEFSFRVLRSFFCFPLLACSLFVQGKPRNEGVSGEQCCDPDPDPHQIERQDPDPHQIDKLDLDLPKFADDRPKCMEYVPTYLSTLCQVLYLYLKARIWIRIRIKVKSRIRARIRIKVTARIRIRIRICIKVMQIRNTALERE